MPASDDKQNVYLDPDTAEIIIEQIAALKERIARAEEQLNLLLLEKRGPIDTLIALSRIIGSQAHPKSPQ